MCYYTWLIQNALTTLHAGSIAHASYPRIHVRCPKGTILAIIITLPFLFSARQIERKFAQEKIFGRNTYIIIMVSTNWAFYAISWFYVEYFTILHCCVCVCVFLLVFGGGDCWGWWLAIKGTLQWSSASKEVSYMNLLILVRVSKLFA